jgi:hypothetical protein
MIDRETLDASVDFVGCEGREFSPEQGSEILQSRSPHPGLAPDPRLPDDTRLWAALTRVSGGTWGGCVYDLDRIVEVLEAGEKALS